MSECPAARAFATGLIHAPELVLMWLLRSWGSDLGNSNQEPLRLTCIFCPSAPPFLWKATIFKREINKKTSRLALCTALLLGLSVAANAGKTQDISAPKTYIIVGDVEGMPAPAPELLAAAATEIATALKTHGFSPGTNSDEAAMVVRVRFKRASYEIDYNEYIPHSRYAWAGAGFGTTLRMNAFSQVDTNDRMGEFCHDMPNHMCHDTPVRVP